MEIAPRRFGEMLNEWFRSLGRTWRPLLLTSLIAHVPLGLAVAFTLLVTGGGESMLALSDPDFVEGLSGEELFEILLPLIWAGLVWVVLQVVATMFVYLASSRVVGADVNGRRAATGEVARFAASRLATAIVSGLVVFAGLLVILAVPVLAGIALIGSFGASFMTVFATTTVALTALAVILWLGLSVSLAVQAIAYDGETAVGAITRSFNLVKSRWWVTLGFLLLAGMIISTASQVISIVFLPLYIAAAFLPGVLALVYGLLLIIQGPVIAAIGSAYALWYIDLRARNENLVAEQLIE